MLLSFHNACERVKLSPAEFFRIAYIWKFQKDGCTTPDFCDFVLCGHHPEYVFPVYVRQFLWASELQERLDA